MKRIASQLLVYASLIFVIWLLGWLLIAGWYQAKFDTSFLPILNYAALPALLVAIICVLAESLMWRLSVNSPVIIMYTFAIRIVFMFIFAGLFFALKITGPESTKVDKVAYVLIVFFNYLAILTAHVISNMFNNRLNDNK